MIYYNKVRKRISYWQKLQCVITALVVDIIIIIYNYYNISLIIIDIEFSLT